MKLKKTKFKLNSALCVLIAMALCPITRVCAQDAGVYAISAPASSCGSLSSASVVTVTVVNFGGADIDSIPIAYQSGLSAPVQDTVLGKLLAGDSVSFTFTVKADFSATGPYSLKAYTMLPSDMNMANDTAKATVYSHAMPSANFSFKNACNGDSIMFSSTSMASGAPITNYAWDFGDRSLASAANPMHMFAKDSTYTVKLIVSAAGGCRDSVSKTVMVFPNPVVNFSAPDVCSGAGTSFTNSSSIKSGTIAGYSWDFGDLGTSNTQAPLHFYANSGSYNVTLTATSDSGCSVSKTLAVHVFQRPTASFSSAGDCQNHSIRFSSPTADSTHPLTYIWSFGDGTGNSNDSVPVHTFSAAGNYNVKLVVTNTSGCKDSVSHSITILPSPSASYTSSPTCIGSATTFTNTSTVASGTITGVTWAFGDGDSSIVSNPVHTYGSAGTYHPVLTVTADNGCTNSMIDSVMIYSLPVASFSSSILCQGQNVAFASSSTGKNLSYIWTFGGTDTTHMENPVHVFADTGAAVVSLLAISPGGCTSLAIDTIFVNPSPVAAFTGADVCFGDSVMFMDSSAITGSGGPLTYSWTFGDSTLSFSKSPSHLFMKPGSFTVTETVTSKAGCAASAVKTVKVHALPVTGFNALTNNTLTVRFIANDSTNGNHYSWSFGDGSAVDTTRTPSHTYGSSGNYVVTLSISNGSCSSTATDTVTVAQTGISLVQASGPALIAYPNPFYGTAHIEYTLTGSEHITLTLCDETGKTISTIDQGNKTPGTYDYDLRTSLAEGVYIIKLQAAHGTSVLRVVSLK